MFNIILIINVEAEVYCQNRLLFIGFDAVALLFLCIIVISRLMIRHTAGKKSGARYYQ
jgi:hypothetical protein